LQDEISGEYQTDIINHSEVLEEEEDDEEETSIAMEIAAGEATPMSIPSSNENSVGWYRFLPLCDVRIKSVIS
jgi:hypothetical protein